MLSVLERTLLGEILSLKFPGIQHEQVAASIREAEVAVTNAVHNSTRANQTPVMAGYAPSNVGNASGVLPTVNSNGHPEWGGRVNHGFNIGPIGIGGGASISNENWLTDRWDDVTKPLVKPTCKLLATAAYNAAMGALTGLNPVAAAAGQAVATAAYHKALEQC